MSAHAHTRNPYGVADVKPIALRLLPAERRQAERIANALGYTMSCLAREAYLRGLPLLAKHAAPVAPSAKKP